MAGTIVCGILAAATFDAFIDRPENGGSITTLLPGVAYATATVMKVCLASGLVSAVVALVRQVSARFRRSDSPSQLDKDELSESAISPSRRVLYNWGLLSVALTPLAPLVSALAVVIAQTLVEKPNGVSLSYFPQIARIGVLVMLVQISTAAVAAVISLNKREGSTALPVLSLVTNAVLIGLFWHFQFYALGFDQDRWAPR